MKNTFVREAFYIIIVIVGWAVFLKVWPETVNVWGMVDLASRGSGLSLFTTIISFWPVLVIPIGVSMLQWLLIERAEYVWGGFHILTLMVCYVILSLFAFGGVPDMFLLKVSVPVQVVFGMFLRYLVDWVQKLN
jgi:hypothetical protein